MLHLIQSSLFKKNVSNQTKNKTLTAIIREMLMLDLVIGQPHSTYDVNIPITYFYFLLLRYVLYGGRSLSPN